jgi:hypothetical protein
MDDGKKYTKYAEDVLRSENAKKLCIPEKVIIAKPAGKKEFADARQTHIDEGVPKGWMIVGSVLPDSALDALNNVEKKGGRLLVAGTPGIVGLDKATPVIVEYANSKNIKAVIVGGDTSSEIKSSAFSLTIGGAGLHYAAYGTTPVWEKLIENKRQFSAW